MKHFFRSHRLPLIISAVLAIMGTIAGLTPYVVVYQIAELTLGAGLNQEDIFLLGGIALSGIFAKVVFSMAANTLSHRVAYHILFNLRVALVEKLNRVPLGFFANKSIGELKKTINEDVEQLEEVLAHAIPDLAAALAVPISCAVILAFVDWRLSLASIVMFPLLVVIYPITLSATKPLSEKYYAALADFRSVAIEFIKGMKVIRAFPDMDGSPQKFNKAISDVAEATRLMSQAALMPGALMTVGLRANVLVILPVGGLLFLSGEVTTNIFVLFLLMGMGMNASAYKLLMTAGTFAMRISAAGKQISSVLDVKELPEPEFPEIPKKFDIKFKKVNFEYEEGNGVKDINFEVPEGSFTAIVGPSGAGKTTIARLVGRFWDVSEGVITIGGIPIQNISSDVLIKNISFILQDAWLLNTTIRENIRSARPDASDQEVEAAAIKACVNHFTDDMEHGLDSPVGEGGKLLSGGQRQRVAIARALLREAPILVMDEATSSLDPDSEAQVLEALSELSKGRTVISIAHRLDTIRSADQILYMNADTDGGEIIDHGSHNELINRCEAYACLCKCYEESGGWRLEQSKSDDGYFVQDIDVGTPSQEPEKVIFPPDSGAVQLFLNLLGGMKNTLLTRAVPLLVLEGIFMGAPVLATVLTLIDIQNETLSVERVWFYTGMVLTFFVLQALFNILANKVLWKVQTATVASLQTRLARHLRHTPLGVLKERATGVLETLITQHVTELNFVTPTSQMVRAVIAPMISLVFMFILDFRLALAVVATLPVFLVAVVFSDRIYNRVWGELVSSKEDMNSRVIDYLQGIATLRSLGLGGGNYSALTTTLTNHRDVSLSTVTRVSPTIAAGLSILDSSFCAVLLVGGLLVVGGSLELAIYMLFLVISLVFYGPISDAFELAAYRRQQERLMGRVMDVFQLPTLSEPTKVSIPKGHDIKFSNVDFSYHQKKALKNVSLNLSSGKLHAFVGASGSGKTTALDILARFWDVDNGSLSVGGVELSALSSLQRAKLFAIVFQDTFLFNDTVSANLCIARNGISKEEMVAAAKAARCHDFIMDLEDGYETTVGENGVKLSGGQRQRLAIARALLKNAPIVLLDEATASIDPETEFEIRAAVGALCKGRTVIVVAHRLSSIIEADQIVVFDQGEITGTGSHEQLLKTCPEYQKLYRAQIGQ